MKKETKKNNKLFNGLLLAFTAVILSIMPIAMITSANSELVGGTPILVRTANLVSPSGTVNPHGVGTYEVYSASERELELEVEDVNLPDGTMITGFVDGNSVGQASLLARKAKIKLKTSLGDTVPTVNAGSTAQMKSGSTVLVAGVFDGPSGTPTPTASPTASPTSSPTASPSGSPTASPTASPSPTGSPSPSPTASPSPSPDNENEITAILTGATINGVVPRGVGAYEVHSSRTELEVNLRQINLPGGTLVQFFVGTTQVGQSSISSGEARLRLRSDRGDIVPVITDGMTLQVKNAGATILSGTFRGSISPSPSPTPTGQGRYFETHLRGSRVTPPVTTIADGEVKVLLNSNETQATISGEFHRLSSNQTSAKIEVTVGGTTTVIRNLGTIGGTSGNFATATVPVTANQVNQLRSGLWVATIASVNNPNGEIAGTLSSHNNGGDFDGDGSHDFSVFRASTGTWYSQSSVTGAFTATTIGGVGDKLISGDYDGDGKTDSAVFRNIGGLGVWDVTRSSDGGKTIQQFGFASDVPVKGDFDGDGRKDLAVYRNGFWYIERSGDRGLTVVQFGIPSDLPVATDFDGDGRDDIAVFRRETGIWYGIRSSDGSFWGAQFGQNDDVPITGDFDGDNKADLAVFRPSNGFWYVRRSSDGSFYGFPFGFGTDLPVAGNYDGDNKTDIAVWRPSNGFWYIIRSSDSGFVALQFGMFGDSPAVANQ
jgi:CHRD domain